MSDGSKTKFRKALLGKELLVGTFVKTPHYQVVEILGLSGLDFLICDAEHAVLDRSTLDTMALAGQATSTPILVRVESNSHTAILQALDIGAAGVVVPHICNARDAQAAVNSSNYSSDAHDSSAGNTRGYSPSTRAGNYGQRDLDEMLELASNEVSVICQIEDPEAVDNIDEIAAVNGVHCLFVGRADLAVSYQVNSLDDDLISEAVQKTCDAARKQDLPVGIYIADVEDIPRWQDQGISFFAVGSDQQFIQAGAKRVADFSPS